ncbi:hypothetical protein L6164_022005 [Bauhinia variegata]|uniref:Uncharacterized protein n=1 Tax=Bauhinia variegata TaxID=167791 RepID=A0ACB9MH55_BAUVA|nr:hypothetical protein L6164_022005 [Bauhinia variegata]
MKKAGEIGEWSNELRSALFLFVPLGITNLAWGLLSSLTLSHQIFTFSGNSPCFVFVLEPTLSQLKKIRFFPTQLFHINGLRLNSSNIIIPWISGLNSN